MFIGAKASLEFFIRECKIIVTTRHVTLQLLIYFGRSRITNNGVAKSLKGSERDRPSGSENIQRDRNLWTLQVRHFPGILGVSEEFRLDAGGNELYGVHCQKMRPAERRKEGERETEREVAGKLRSSAGAQLARSIGPLGRMLRVQLAAR